MNNFMNDFMKYTNNVYTYYREINCINFNRGYFFSNPVRDPTEQEMQLYTEDVEKYKQYVQRYEALLKEHQRLVDVYPSVETELNEKNFPEWLVHFFKNIEYNKPYDYASSRSLMPDHPLIPGQFPPRIPLTRQFHEEYNWFIQVNNYMKK